MDRRAFLRNLATATAAVAAGSYLDPEFMTWRPGSKTIFLPPARPVVVPQVREATPGDLESIVRFSDVQKRYINDGKRVQTYEVRNPHITLTLSAGAYEDAARHSPGLFRDVNVMTTNRKTGKTMHLTQEILRAQLLMND
jgi:hypothetical protein